MLDEIGRQLSTPAFLAAQPRSEHTPEQPPTQLGQTHLGGVQNCVQAMGNGEYSAVLEVGSDGALNESICLPVNRCCGFICHQHLGLAQQGSCHTQQLPLAHAEIVTPLCHTRSQAICQLTNCALQPTLSLSVHLRLCLGLAAEDIEAGYCISISRQR